jgi:hypothetical protein
MAEPSILFHVGYHKTGTTWMQRRLFQPAHGYDPLMDHDGVFATITRPHRLAFDPAVARAALAARPAGAGLVPVVSSEILSGHPFWGGRDSADFAERIARIAPDARILITIRAQIPAIASVYMQYVRRAGLKDPESFFRGPGILGFDGFDPVHFEYHRLAGHYRSLFGADRVLVLTQERLAADPAGFVARLAAFAGAPEAPIPSTAREGVSESEAAVWLLRRINRLRRDGAGQDPVADLGRVGLQAYRVAGWFYRRPFMKRLAAGRPVTATARRLFAGRFGPSNRALLDMMPGLDLPGYET